jgi:uncharacterized protein (TIGR02266 family)
MSDATENNRRRHPRVDLRLVVQFRSPDVESFMAEHALNVSMGGMFVRSETLHPVGAHIFFQFMLDEGEALIEGMGRVVRHVPAEGNAGPGMGVEFLNLDEKSAVFVERLVSRRLKKEAT